MNRNIYSAFVLVISIILVHLIYVAWINPNVEIIQNIAAQTGSILPRNLFIIIKDFEQEICIILFIWGIFLCGSNYLQISNYEYLYGVDLLDDVKLDSTNALQYLESFDELSDDVKKAPLVEIIMSSLRRYALTGNIESAASSIEPALEALSIRNENDLAILKYISWAIPSIGFLGTVRGIGQAMSEAEAAVAGNIAPMTSSLGVAFNSTFIALIISIFLMLALSYIQKEQDSQLIKIKNYTEKYLINRIHQSS